MEAKNELSSLTKEELILKVEQLEKTVREVKKSATHWWDRYSEIDNKFNSFKSMIKGLIVLVDDPSNT